MLSELEKQAEAYAKAKESKSSDVGTIANRLVDAVSSPDFVLPLKDDTQSASGTTTYLYENDASYPALFAFIAEVLHTKVPIEIRSTKFGPGEVIVKTESKDEANRELASSLKVLRELVRAKKSQVSTKYSSA